MANIGFFDEAGVIWPDAPMLTGITKQLSNGRPQMPGSRCESDPSDRRRQCDVRRLRLERPRDRNSYRRSTISTSTRTIARRRTREVYAAGPLGRDLAADSAVPYRVYS
jgi:hypothetical protein